MGAEVSTEIFLEAHSQQSLIICPLFQIIGRFGFSRLIAFATHLDGQLCLDTK